jgi:3-deoxy-D-manno-octulosonic-acid transferase
VNLGLVLYNALLPAAGLVARCAAPFNRKIAEGLKGREGFKARWREKCAHLERRGRVVWFHVSSVGEFEQAKPVMTELSSRLGSSLEIALTFYSPSGMSYFERFDRSKRIEAIRFLDYLPIDTPANARFCLDALEPDMLVFVKYDLWPNLVCESSRRGVPLVLVSGTLSPDSRRLAWPARSLYAAVSEEDAGRFRKDLRSAVDIVAAGDTRFDRVCERIDGSTVKIAPAIAAAGRTWIVAGSTWPRDEAVVIPGFAALRGAHPAAGLILVPHEPTAPRLAEISAALGRRGLPFSLLSKLLGETAPEQVVVADGIGYLAELYRAGTLAYVGGSFTTGVHNVMEPAVLGLPVFFGPRIDNSLEARELVKLGSGEIVRSPDEFAAAASALLDDRELLRRKGEAASKYVRGGCGAARRSVDVIEKHLTPKT